MPEPALSIWMWSCRQRGIGSISFAALRRLLLESRVIVVPSLHSLACGSDIERLMWESSTLASLLPVIKVIKRLPTAAIVRRLERKADSVDSHRGKHPRPLGPRCEHAMWCADELVECSG